jgi:hypothetical protein
VGGLIGRGPSLHPHLLHVLLELIKRFFLKLKISIEVLLFYIDNTILAFIPVHYERKTF